MDPNLQSLLAALFGLLRVVVLGVLIVIAVVIGFFAVVMAGDKYHWGWTEITVRYRVSFGVEVGGIRYDGASVVQITYQRVPRWQAWAWIDAPPGGAIYRGQAATVRLGDGKVLCVLMHGETFDRRRSSNSVGRMANRLLAPLAKSGGGRDRINTFNASLVSGSADIPPDLLPAMVLIENAQDPRSAHVFDPDQPEKWLGPGARFLGARIEVTSEPRTTGISAVLPWLADRAVREQLTGRDDPFHRESDRNNLFKYYFY